MSSTAAVSAPFETPYLPVLLRSQAGHRCADPGRCDRCLEFVAQSIARDLNWDLNAALVKTTGSYWGELGERTCSLERALLLRALTAQECVRRRDDGRQQIRCKERAAAGYLFQGGTCRMS